VNSVTVAQLLDRLRPELDREWPCRLTESESRTLVGLNRFQVYASVPVAAWLEGVFSEDEFAELSESSMVTNLRECADYITPALTDATRLADASLSSGWHAVCLLLTSVQAERRGPALAIKAVVLYLSAVALCIHAGSLLGGGIDQQLSADDKLTARQFFDRVVDYCASVDLPVDVHEKASVFLVHLESRLRLADWI
jgi:hypothetical protein